MKLEKWLETYQEASKQTSDIARQLAFASLAVVWIFRNNEGGPRPVLTGELVEVAFFATMTLALDLLQFVFKSFVLGIFFRVKSNSAEMNDDVRLPKVLSLVTWVLFVTKLIALIWSYWCLLSFLLQRIT